MLSRRLFSWLFALTLLFGQAATFAHALGHLHGHDPALPDNVCEVCVAQAQLGSAVPPSLARLTIPAAGCIMVSSAAHVCVDLAPRHACARAPPAPSDL